MEKKKKKSVGTECNSFKLLPQYSIAKESY